MNLQEKTYSLKIPTIALITESHAGFSIALACDFRIGNKDSFLYLIIAGLA